MKKFILFVCILPYAINSAESTYRIVENLKQGKEIAWLSNGTILMIGQSQENQEKTTHSLFSIDTKNNFAQKELYTFKDEDNREPYLITLNHNKTTAFISISNTSFIYDNRTMKEEKQIETHWRPLISSGDNIVFIKNNLFYTYNGKDIQLDEELNAVQKEMEKRPFAQHCHELLKNPNNDTYILVGQPEIFQWNKKTKDLEVIPLRDLAILPIEMPISPYDLHYHSNGTHTTFTYDVPYNCWIYNLKTEKLLILKHAKENQKVKALRNEYEAHPTHENGRLLINAAWNAQYHIDSKVFHPTLAVIATLAKNKGILKYWDINTGQKIMKQQLPYKTGINPNGCMPRLLAFSPDGKQIACALNQALVIVQVPKIIFEKK